MLLNEWEHHRDMDNRKPTALVSVSDRIVDTVQRAYEKYYDFDEDPKVIWIAFIRVSNRWRGCQFRVHWGVELAEEYGWDDAGAFRHEFVFEWSIPEDFL